MVMVRMARPQQRTAAGQLVRAAQHPYPGQWLKDGSQDLSGRTRICRWSPAH